MPATAPKVVGATTVYGSGTQTQITLTQDIPAGSHVVVVFGLGAEYLPYGCPVGTNTGGTVAPPYDPPYSAALFPDPNSGGTFNQNNIPYTFKVTDDAGNLYGWNGVTDVHSVNTGVNSTSPTPQGYVESPLILGDEGEYGASNPKSNTSAGGNALGWCYLLVGVFASFRGVALTSGQKITIQHPGSGLPTWTGSGLSYTQSGWTTVSAPRIAVALLLPRVGAYAFRDRAIYQYYQNLTTRGRQMDYRAFRWASTGTLKNSAGTAVDGCLEETLLYDNLGNQVDQGTNLITYGTQTRNPPTSGCTNAEFYTQGGVWLNAPRINGSFHLLVNFWDGGPADTRALVSGEGWTSLGDWGVTTGGTYNPNNPNAPNSSYNTTRMPQRGAVAGRTLDKHLQIAFRYVNQIEDQAASIYRTGIIFANQANAEEGYFNSGMISTVDSVANGRGLVRADLYFPLSVPAIAAVPTAHESRRYLAYERWETLNDTPNVVLKEQRLGANSRFTDGPQTLYFAGPSPTTALSYLSPHLLLGNDGRPYVIAAGIGDLFNSQSVYACGIYCVLPSSTNLGSARGYGTVGGANLATPSLYNVGTHQGGYGRLARARDGVIWAFYYDRGWVLRPLVIGGANSVNVGSQAGFLANLPNQKEGPCGFSANADRSFLISYVDTADNVVLAWVSRVGATAGRAKTVIVGQGSSPSHVDLEDGRILVAFYDQGGWNQAIVTRNGTVPVAGTPKTMGLPAAPEAPGFLRLRSDRSVEFTYFNQQFLPVSVYCRSVRTDATGVWTS